MFKNKKNTNHINNSCWFLSVHFWRRFSHPKSQGKKGDLMNSSPRSDLILPWNDYSQITCWEWDQLGWIHPGRLTWNLRIHPWKRKIIFQTIIFRFYVNCYTPSYSNGPWHWMFRGKRHQGLARRPGTKRKFIFQPKWGANYWYYWFQGGDSTVLANQRFADEMIPPIKKERLTHIATFIQFCSCQSVKEPTKQGVLDGFWEVEQELDIFLVKNLWGILNSERTSQHGNQSHGPFHLQNTWENTERKRTCTFFILSFYCTSVFWLMPSNHMNLL